MKTTTPGDSAVLCMAPEAAHQLTKTPPSGGVVAPSTLPEWARGYMRTASAPYVRRVGPAAAATAIIRIDGPIVGDSGWWYEGMLTLTHASVAQAINDAVADATVARIALEFDCPGWGCVGCDTLLEALAAAKAAKPMVARVYGVCLSGGAWMASMCSEVSASENSFHGSLGCLTVKYDDSRRFSEEGVDPLVFAWPHGDKAAGHPGVAWSETARAAIQNIIEDVGRKFLGAVASGRGVKLESLVAMNGNMLTVTAAVEAGLVDVIETQQRWESRMTANAARAAAPSGAPSNSGPTQRAKERSMDLSAMKPEDLRAQAPNLVRQIEEGAVAAATEAASKAANAPATFAQLKEMFGDDAAAIVASQTAGHTVAQARDAQMTALVAKVSAQETELVALREKAKKPVLGAEPVSAGGKAGATSYADAVKAVREAEGVSHPIAMHRAARKYPEAYKRWKEEGCPAVLS